MKRIRLVVIFGFFVLACSYTTLLPATPAVPAPVALSTATENPASLLTPSVIGTQPTPTFTPTPTYIYSGSSPTPYGTATATGTVIVYITVLPTSTSSPIATTEFLLTPVSPVFDSVMISGTSLTWGSTCQNNSVEVTARIASGYNVGSVLLFTRLSDQTNATTTDWNNGTTMKSTGASTYTYNLSAASIKSYKDFNLAWVQFQLVATNTSQKVLGRSQPYLNNLTLGACP